MNSFSFIFSLSMFLLLVSPEFTFAYVGPGAGIGTIGTVLALIGAVFLAIVSFIWYPIKRLFLNKNKKMKVKE